MFRQIRIAVLASGSGSNLQVLIDQLHKNSENSVEIAVVISDRSNAYALMRAKLVGIPTCVVRLKDHLDRVGFDAEIARQIEKYHADLIVLAGFMKIFQPEFVRKFRNKIINVHPSILPAFPGAHAPRDTIAYGAKISGVTVHFVDEGVDTGPIIAQIAVPIFDDDDESTLHARIQIEEHKIYPQVIKCFAEGRIEVKDRKVRILPPTIGK